MLYEVYVQGKYLKSVETNDSMSLVWKITHLIDSGKALAEIPWYDESKLSNIKVVPEDFDVDFKGISTI